MVMQPFENSVIIIYLSLYIYIYFFFLRLASELVGCQIQEEGSRQLFIQPALAASGYINTLADCQRHKKPTEPYSPPMKFINNNSGERQTSTRNLISSG